MTDLFQHRNKIALIGASPIIIINAIELAKKGFEVTIFDKKTIGGSWRCEKIFSNIVDSGVHYLYYHANLSELVQFLNNNYNLGLKKIVIPAKGDESIYFCNYPEFSFKTMRSDLRLKLQEHLSFKNFKRSLLNSGASQYYFDGGCLGLISRLREQISNLNIEINENELVNEIKLENKNIKIQTNKRSLLFDKVIVSSRSLPNKTFGVYLNDLVQEKGELQHVHMLVSRSGPLKFSFYKMIDQNIFGACDHRYYMQQLKIRADSIAKLLIDEKNINDFTIISFALNRNVDAKNIDNQLLLWELKKRCLISNDAKCEKVKIQKDPFINIDKSKIEKISNKKLLVIAYDNLSRELVNFCYNPHFEELFKGLK